MIHNSKRLICASKDGTFERENYYVSPADSLNGWDAARLRPPWLHFVWDIPAKPVDTKAHRRRGFSWGLMSQRTLPPSGRVTTLVPFPFFFRRAFIAIKIKIKHEDECIVKKLDSEMRQTTTSGNKVGNFRMIDVERIANGRTLQKTRNRGILDSAKRKGFKSILFEVTYLDEVDFESRINSANNNMNLCHNDII